MKFDISSHEIVKNHSQIFRKDLCTHARTQGENVRLRISSRQNEHVHVFALCARVYARIFTKNHLIIIYYLMIQSLKGSP